MYTARWVNWAERALIEHGLVDELRLFVFPVVVGAGERLFGNFPNQFPVT
jgi:dihydrofolate reductase